VINARSRNGWQIILEDAELSTRHPLFALSEEEQKAV
jgi:hypothetical protein